MAYQYYLKSAGRGHIKGAVLLANIWTTGIPGHVNRRPLDAVLLATYPFIYFMSRIWFSHVSCLKCLFNWLQVGEVGSWAQRIPGQHLAESPGFVSQEWHVIFFSIHTWRDPDQVTWLQLQQTNTPAFQQVHLTVILHDGCWVRVRSCPIQCGISMWTEYGELSPYQP